VYHHDSSHSQPYKHHNHQDAHIPVASQPANVMIICAVLPHGDAADSTAMPLFAGRPYCDAADCLAGNPWRPPHGDDYICWETHNDVHGRTHVDAADCLQGDLIKAMLLTDWKPMLMSMYAGRPTTMSPCADHNYGDTIQQCPCLLEDAMATIMGMGTTRRLCVLLDPQQYPHLLGYPVWWETPVSWETPWQQACGLADP